MKTALYPRLAWDGIRKNKKLFYPYLLTCICMVMMFYIISFLSSQETLALLPRGMTTAGLLLNFGKIVILVFSAVFLYYTNSFLVRRREREFGLYNVLGMGKRSLARIVTWESLITAALSLSIGLALGILFSKLAELGLINLLGGEITYRVRIDAQSLCNALVFYALIFAVIWLSSVIRVGRSSAVALLRSENVGEKPPRANWVLGLSGLFLLALAYYMAVAIANPADAAVWFFVAVILVILATYLLMISGSVLLCRILQKNKKYYYRPNHFVSVSSMAYRMKRNGAGLASVCIIATMILVMISSSSSLYFGAEDSIAAKYPRETNLTFVSETGALPSEDDLSVARKCIAELTAEKNVELQNVQDYRFANVTGVMNGSTAQCDYAAGSYARRDLRDFYVISAADYQAQTGESVTLADDEALVLTVKKAYAQDSITLTMGDASHTWRVKEAKTGTIIVPATGATEQMTLIVNDVSAAVEGFDAVDESGMRRVSFKWVFNFDTDQDEDALDEFSFDLMDAIDTAMNGEVGDDRHSGYIMFTSREGNRDEFYGTYGALFFIGIMLTLVFILAAVLILYYKQISEGYEDQKRFEIMQKVGMTKKDIRRSIDSQLLTVFFLPLLMAGMHLAFAFPMIRRLLVLFSLYNTGLFALTTLISFGVFAVFYAIVYRITARAYYNIVSA